MFSVGILVVVLLVVVVLVVVPHLLLVGGFPLSHLPRTTEQTYFNARKPRCFGGPWTAHADIHGFCEDALQDV